MRPPQRAFTPPCTRTQDLPEFEPIPLRLADLVAEGERLVREQDAVNASKLGEEYMVRHVACVCVWGEEFCCSAAQHCARMCACARGGVSVECAWCCVFCA
jgi:hypothetical protein